MRTTLKFLGAALALSAAGAAFAQAPIDYNATPLQDAGTLARAAQGPRLTCDAYRAGVARMSEDAKLNPAARALVTMAQYGGDCGITKLSKTEALAKLREVEPQARIAGLYTGMIYLREGEPELARYWLDYAGKQGVAEAYLGLAALYATGTTVAQDGTKAQQYLALAAKQGNKLAAELAGLPVKVPAVKCDPTDAACDDKVVVSVTSPDPTVSEYR